MSRLPALLIVMTAAGLAQGREVTRLGVHSLRAGERFQIETADRVYRGEVIDSAKGEVRIATSNDGAEFAAPAKMYLLGATQGRSAQTGGLMVVVMHEIAVGMKMELGAGSLEQKDRQVTAPVKSIKITADRRLASTH